MTNVSEHKAMKKTLFFIMLLLAGCTLPDFLSLDKRSDDAFVSFLNENFPKLKSTDFLYSKTSPEREADVGDLVLNGRLVIFIEILKRQHFVLCYGIKTSEASDIVSIITKQIKAERDFWDNVRKLISPDGDLYYVTVKGRPEFGMGYVGLKNGQLVFSDGLGSSFKDPEFNLQKKRYVENQEESD